MGNWNAEWEKVREEEVMVKMKGKCGRNKKAGIKYETRSRNMRRKK